MLTPPRGVPCGAPRRTTGTGVPGAPNRKSPLRDLEFPVSQGCGKPGWSDRLKRMAVLRL